MYLQKSRPITTSSSSSSTGGLGVLGGGNTTSASAANNGNGNNVATENLKRFKNLDEGELFMELIRDVANELDIDVLCHKILVNVSLLTYADRGSLFLAKGSANNRYLVAKLFDVTEHTGKTLFYINK